MPQAQTKERSALTLLALLALTPDKDWREASAPLVGITPIMDWCRDHYGKIWKPNTRESVRRQTIHQFVAAGLALYNPDQPGRAVNSQWAAYQITPEALDLLRAYNTPLWETARTAFLAEKPALVARYAAERDMNLLPVLFPTGGAIRLSAGKHSALIKSIIEEFAPRFVPSSQPLYVGDTGKKWAFFDEQGLREVGATLDSHGKMPDVVLFDRDRGWLVLVESVTSHGPVDPKRHGELAQLFGTSTAPLVYVTAFATRASMKRHLTEISWETEVWCADAPSHLIHFNGIRFLGPY